MQHLGWRGIWWTGVISASVLLSGCRWNCLSDAVPESVALGRTLDREGLAAAERGDWEAAEEKFRLAIESNPEDSVARLHHANALWQHGERTAARNQVAEAARLAPKDPQIRVRWAEMLLASGKLGAAAAQAEQALELDPRLSCAWSLRGEIRFQQGEAQAALSDYYRALRLTPGDPPTLRRLCTAYQHLGQPHMALAALQDAGEQYPPGNEPPDLLVCLGEAYLAVDRTRDALETLAQASVRGPLPPELSYRIAAAELQAGAPDRARYSLRQALEHSPHHQASLALWQRIEESDTRR